MPNRICFFSRDKIRSKWIQIRATENEKIDLNIFYLSFLCKILVESSFLRKISIFSMDTGEIKLEGTDELK